METGDSWGQLGANSVDWIAIELELMAEGIVAVPLYHRQTPAELVAMLKDCQPRLILTGDAELGDALTKMWPGLPQRALFSEILANSAATSEFSPVRQRPDGELLTIIYTSG